MAKGIVGRVGYLLVIAAVVTELLSVINVRTTVAATPVSIKVDTGAPISLPWPDTGQAALAARGFGLLGQSGTMTPVPTASVAKVITALAVLKKAPLKPNETGPTYTIGQADIDNYQRYLSEDGSVVPVQLGETITERQAIEAMLLPSANNIAFSLASWVFGSLDAYINYVNQYVKTLGMTSTTVNDASGFSPQTVSTATDLVKLGEAALAEPTLSQIASEQQADIPVAGTIRNVNWLLGEDGIVGIKTGNTNEAGGCFLFAANRDINGRTVTVYGVILGAPDLRSAMDDGRSLILAADKGFKTINVLVAGQIVARYESAWGSSASAITQKPLSLMVWSGQPVTLTYQLKAIKSGAPDHSAAGSVTATAPNQKISTSVVTNSAIKKPPIKWRLLHPSF